MPPHPAAKAFLIFSGLVLGAITATVLLLVVANVQTSENREQVKENSEVIQDVHKLLEIVLAVTGCTREDSPERCRQRVSDASRLEGQRRVLDVDCRLRRALSGKPPPDPDAPCTP